jgi:hypothetical protein
MVIEREGVGLLGAARAIRRIAGWKEAEELSTCSHWSSEAAKLDCSRRLSSSPPPMQRPGPRCTFSSHSGSGGVGRGDGKTWASSTEAAQAGSHPRDASLCDRMRKNARRAVKSPGTPGREPHHPQIAAGLLLWFGRCHPTYDQGAKHGRDLNIAIHCCRPLTAGLQVTNNRFEKSGSGSAPWRMRGQWYNLHKQALHRWSATDGRVS